MKKPCVFSFLNYRKFLWESFQYLKSTEKMTQQEFAKKVGFGSPSYLGMIVKEQRNLSLKSAKKLSKILKLNSREERFFELLIQFQLVDDLAQKDEIYQKILSFKEHGQFFQVESAQYHYFSHWYEVVIFEALGTDWAKWPMEKQAESLDLSVKELKTVFENLQTLGVVEKRGRNWFKRNAYVETAAETGSLAIRNFHKQMTLKSLESLDRDPKEKRSHFSATLILSEAQTKQLRKMLHEFATSLSPRFGQSRDARYVYQVNLQAFPLLDFEEASQKTSE